VPLNPTLSQSEAGENLTKSFEGYSLSAYRDGAGVPTIGWGHTLGVAMGQRITPGQAETDFVSDMAHAVAGVNASASTATQNQFDALVDFAFNEGTHALATSTLLRLHNSGDHVGAAAQFARWDIAGGEVENGLVKRRAAEMRLYSTL